MFKFKGNEIYDIMNLGALIFLTVEMFLLKWNNKENLLVKFLMNFFFFKWLHGSHLKGNRRSYKIKNWEYLDNHEGITYLEPDILEWKVKWALGSITVNKASEGDGIPAELFKILKDDAVKVLHSICQQIWKPQQWPQAWKRSVFIPIPKKGNAKTCSNYHIIELISYGSTVMLKIPQARLQ